MSSANVDSLVLIYAREFKSNSRHFLREARVELDHRAVCLVFSPIATSSTTDGHHGVKVEGNVKILNDR